MLNSQVSQETPLSPQYIRLLHDLTAHLRKWFRKTVANSRKLTAQCGVQTVKAEFLAKLPKVTTFFMAATDDTNITKK